MDRRALARSRTTVKKCAQCHGKLGLGWYSLSRSRHSIVSFFAFGITKTWLVSKRGAIGRAAGKAADHARPSLHVTSHTWCHARYDERVWSAAGAL